jgi:hypothetical protein
MTSAQTMPAVVSRCLLALGTIAVALCAFVARAPAQENPAAGLPIRSGADVTFELLARAPYQRQFQTEQIRRFQDGAGAWVELRERLTVEGNGVEDSPFRLEFVPAPVSDTSTGPAQRDWQQTYAAHAGLLYRHGSFHVHDVNAARANYSIYDFGVARRLDRDVRRVVILPRQTDKAVWLLDVDVATGLLLYSAEFDISARLISELEVTQLRLGSASVTQVAGWNWTPRLTIVPLNSASAATARIRAGSPTVPAIGTIVPEYVLARAHVAENPLNQDQTLVYSYSDGVDEFFVSEAFGSQDPFAVNPVTLRNPGTHTHTIASYDDPGLRAYVFHENGVTFQVVGRGSLQRLQEVARQVCRQAVLGI